MSPPHVMSEYYRIHKHTIVLRCVMQMIHHLRCCLTEDLAKFVCRVTSLGHGNDVGMECDCDEDDDDDDDDDGGGDDDDEFMNNVILNKDYPEEPCHQRNI